MKIIFIQWESYGTQDILNIYRSIGHNIIMLPFNRLNCRRDDEFEQALTKCIQLHLPDYIFSFNYFPVVSQTCNKIGIPYVAWVYDSPYVLLYSYTTLNACNHIYVFDRELCREFNQAGIHTVKYLPMAANTSRLDACLLSNIPDEVIPLLPHSNITFIGSMYTEKHQFYERLTGITEYTKGYLEAIMNAQQKVYGYNFIQELLTPDIIEDLYRILPMKPNRDGVESREYLYSEYVINRNITRMERFNLLSSIGKLHSLDVYTPDIALNSYGITRHAPIDYYDHVPYIIKRSKINLNITLRSIKSGIPLRAFDIMGAGGFLLTNYQSDFLDHFVPGEDFVYFDSEADMLTKIAYYLNHEEERKTIAKNGYNKVTRHHTYLHRIYEWEADL